MTDVLAGTPAPEVTPPPAANAVPAPDAPTGQESASDVSVQPSKTYTEEENRRIVSERLKKESRRMERTIRAEVERDFLQRQLEEGRNAAAPKADQPKGKPQEKDFKDWESYQDAVVDWKLEQRLAAEREKSTRESSAEKHNREMAQRAQFIRENVVAKGKKEFSDFEDVAMGDVTITMPMAAAIARLPAGHKVWYHLGRNPDEADRISQLPDVEQLWEIKALESKLTAPPSPTKTPPPIVPNGQQASNRKDWGGMTTADHIKAYRERKRRRD